MEAGTTLLAIALKTGALLALVAFANRLLAGRSAACRHLLWSIALLLSLLLPLASSLLPPVLVVAMPSSGPASALDAPAFATAGAVTPWAVAGYLWLCGTLVLLVRHLLTEAGMLRWMRRTRPAEGSPWLATLATLPRNYRVARPLRVLESTRVSTPCTWGAIRPVLLLPASGADWSEEERRYALLHELAHVRRFDYVTGLIARLACALHWYNPLVWVAARQLHLLQEQACDDAVLRGGETPSRYARLLVDLAGQLPIRAPLPGFALNMAQTFLRRRVVAILDSQRMRPSLQAYEAMTICLSLCGLALLLATSTVVDAHDTRVWPRDPLSPLSALPSLEALPVLEPIPPQAPLEALPAVPAPAAVPALPASRPCPHCPQSRPYPHSRQSRPCPRFLLPRHADARWTICRRTP